MEYYRGASMLRMMNIFNGNPPCLCVLSYNSIMINRFDGIINYNEFISLLLNSINYNDAEVTPRFPLRRHMSSRDRMTSFRRVIDEQDKEYKEAVEIDTLRLKELNDKRMNDERIKEEKLNDRKLINDRRIMLSNEYKILDHGDVKIKVKLPDGKTIEGYFNKNDTINEIYNWVEVIQITKGIKIPYNFHLTIPFPLQVLSDRNLTLEKANLVPNASILLTSLDDTSDDE